MNRKKKKFKAFVAAQEAEFSKLSTDLRGPTVFLFASDACCHTCSITH
jgi:ribosomal protein L10